MLAVQMIWADDAVQLVDAQFTHPAPAHIDDDIAAWESRSVCPSSTQTRPIGLCGGVPHL